jgi:transposase
MVKNYKKILMPVFGVQNMVKKNKNNFKSKKELNKNNRLNKRVKFVLSMLSFYKFRQHLHNKGMEYGCEIKDVTEEETSQCCGRCGVLSNEYKNRIKNCRNCGLNIHRDINGSRNILIKNWKGNYKTR